MSKSKNPTVNEHFVPKVYLRGFSSDGKRVWKYELSSLSEPPKLVPIESICREKDVYEIKHNGKYIKRNYFENCLSVLEGEFEKHRNRLVAKIMPVNYETKCFLTTEEKFFWKAYIVFQMLRNPIVIKRIESLFKSSISVTEDGELAKYLALTYCMPFDPNIEGRENSGFFEVVSIVDKMSIMVGVDIEERIITSDNPVYALTPEYGMNKCQIIYFPITSNIVIILNSERTVGGNNRLFPLDVKDVVMIDKALSYTAHDRIFSIAPIAEEILENVRSARNDKNEDVTKGRLYE